MLEIGSDASRRFLDSPKVAQSLAMKGRFVARRDVGVDGALEIPVEVLVGIELGRVWREEENLDRGRARGKPLPHLRRLVHVEVVEDQEDLLLSVADQPAQEDDESRRTQSSLED